MNKGLQGLIVSVMLIFSVLSHAEDLPNKLENIDFRVNKNKDAVLIIELATSTVVVDVQRAQEGLSIELINTHVDDNKLQLLDVKDFATLVEGVEVYKEAPSTRLLATISKDYQYEYNLKGRFIEVVISKPAIEEAVTEKSILEKEGKLISINFQDIPVRNVLQLIADYNDFNLVVSDSVTGNLTLRLDGVPWQQVLDIILQVKGLDKRVDGNVILVAPKDELDLREQQALEKSRLEEELGELKSEIIKIHFAKATDIADMIGGDGTVSMLSDRGSITIDERTNSLLIRELEENIAVIRSIIESLDIPVKQVQIEARIVTVTEGNLDELGVRWGASSTNGSFTVGGSIEGNYPSIAPYDSNGGNSVIDEYLNVNLGATSSNASSIAFQVAKLGSDTLLDLELSALQQESKAEIISSPRLITTNKKPAYIEQGTLPSLLNQELYDLLNSPNYFTSTVKVKTFTRNDATGTWAESQITQGGFPAGENYSIRDIEVYTDSITGSERIYATVGVKGIFVGKYSPTSPGKIAWVSTAEYGPVSIRPLGIATANNNLYFSSGNKLYKRTDGTSPSYSIVHDFSDLSTSINSAVGGIRGLTTIDNPNGTNQAMLLMWCPDGQSAGVIYRLEPNSTGGFNRFYETKLSVLIQGYLPGSSAKYVLGAYNEFYEYVDPITSNAFHLVGFEATIIGGGHPTWNGYYKGSLFAKRDSNGQYSLEEVNGSIGINDTALVATRCYVSSPFSSENALYFGGFDPNGNSATNKAWVYKKDNLYTSINKIENQDLLLRIYPNPTSQILSVEVESNECLDYKIISVLGKTVTSGRVCSIKQIDVSELSPNVYFLKVGNQTKKFIKSE